MSPSQPRLYSEFASWFHLLTAPESYVEEAEFSRSVLVDAVGAPPQTVLELGCGGGNNAFHLKHHFELTLTDLSPAMLEQSRSLNPECEHVQGDMRTLRLGRTFDAVFVHDAVTHLTHLDDVRDVMETAFVHCRPGGAALFMPDVVREKFRQGVHHGGHDGGERSLRYMEWTFDPDPSDSTYTVDFVYMLREGSGPIRVEHDVHINGLFSRTEWRESMRSAGFEPTTLEDPWGREVFVGKRLPLGSA